MTRGRPRIYFDDETAREADRVRDRARYRRKNGGTVQATCRGTAFTREAALADALSYLTDPLVLLPVRVGRCDILDCEQDAYGYMGDVMICSDCWERKTKARRALNACGLCS